MGRGDYEQIKAIYQVMISDMRKISREGERGRWWEAAAICAGGRGAGSVGGSDSGCCDGVVKQDGGAQCRDPGEELQAEEIRRAKVLGPFRG